MKTITVTRELDFDFEPRLLQFINQAQCDFDYQIRITVTASFNASHTDKMPLSDSSGGEPEEFYLEPVLLTLNGIDASFELLQGGHLEELEEVATYEY